jgi:hypothetical protein
MRRTHRPPAASADGSGCRARAYCLWTKKNFEGKKLVVKTKVIAPAETPVTMSLSLPRG